MRACRSSSPGATPHDEAGALSTYPIRQHGTAQLCLTGSGDSNKRMIGLGNRLIHEYDDVDAARLLPLLDRLDDLHAFANWYVNPDFE